MTVATQTGATGTTQPPPAVQQPQETKPAEPKPQETKPAEQKPTEKPVETKPESDLLLGEAGAEEPKAADVAVEIKVPEGVEVNKEMLDGFVSIAKELKLDSKAAQKVVDFYVGAQKASDERLDTAWATQKTEWREAAKKDAEIGGPKFEENVKIARNAIEKFGGQGLKDALRDLGIASHPEIVRFALKVGRALSEDSIDLKGGPAGGSDAEVKLKEAFPSMYGK